MAKILMINLPYAGHTNPTLPLARCLAARGHEVSYIHAPEWQEKIAATGATFIPYLDYPAGLSEQQKKRRCFSAAYRTLMAVGKDYDLLIYEMLFFPTKRLAARLGIPCVRQFSQPAWNQKAFQKLESSSEVFLLSSKLIGKQLMNASAAREMELERLKLVDSVLNDVPDLNIVYLPDFFNQCVPHLTIDLFSFHRQLRSLSQVKSRFLMNKWRVPLFIFHLARLSAENPFIVSVSRPLLISRSP